MIYRTRDEQQKMEGESYGILKVRDALLFLVLRPFARTTNCKNINCPNNSTITAPAVNKVFIISVDSQPFTTFTAPWTQDKKAVVYITQLHGRGLCPKSDATGVIRHTFTLTQKLYYFGTAATVLHTINV